jgi:hypothetical protein
VEEAVKAIYDNWGNRATLKQPDAVVNGERVFKVGSWAITVPADPDQPAKVSSPYHRWGGHLEPMPNVRVSDGEMRIPIDDLADLLLRRTSAAELAVDLLIKLKQDLEREHQARGVLGIELKALGLSRDSFMERSPGHVYDPTGCRECMDTGYTGRTGIYEMMMIDDDIRPLVMDNVASSVIKKAAIKKGMLTLRDDGARKVLLGETSISEILRVTQDDLLSLE